MEAIQKYLAALETDLKRGDATEHTHRPALKSLVDEITGFNAVNEPKRTACGAPDFVVLDSLLPVGHIECKDVGLDLNKVEKIPQLKRYLPALPNLILTDYLEFRWFVDGKVKMTISIGRWNGRHLVYNDAGIAQLVTLLKQFAETRTKTIRTAKQLAILLAGKARLLDHLVLESFATEGEKGELHEQLSTLRELLVPDMDEKSFADMYAQTVAYGLFAARIFDPTPETFNRYEAATLLPPTNPLLREFFTKLGSYEMENDPAIVWCVEEMCQLFMHVDIRKVLEDFSRRKGFEDPIIHFYETFLHEYDPAEKRLRGQYYTPTPVVSFIVHSVDEILKMKFGKPNGFADKSVMVLDPAAGTATFLRSVIELINNYFIDNDQQGTWNTYVPEYVLNRLFGFELKMAPYAVAHLKLGEQLKETGYKFESGERLGIYLTNTLEEAVKKSETLLGLAKKIADESDAASHIKRDEPVMVVLGNPPYAGHSSNPSWKYIIQETKSGKQRKKKVPTFIGSLMQDYYQLDGKPLRERNSKWLQDDYVKFIRFSQWKIAKTGHGVVAMITNHGYLDNPTFRGMRQSLINTFDEIYILDLHGSTKKKEKAPDGSIDENVFDIEPGVAICFMVKFKEKQARTSVLHASIWGKREAKYAKLEETTISSIDWCNIEPESPFYFLIPKDRKLINEYNNAYKITDIMPVNNTGMVSKRDSLAFKIDKEDIVKIVNDIYNLDAIDITRKYPLSSWKSRDGKVEFVKKSVMEYGIDKNRFVQVLYRPFDKRWTYYTPKSKGLIAWPVYEVMKHMLTNKNIALTTTRTVETGGFEHIFMIDGLATHHTVSVKEVNYAFPLYLYPFEGETQRSLLLAKEKHPNLAPEFVDALCKRLGLMFDPESHRGIHTNGPAVIANLKSPAGSGCGMVKLSNGEKRSAWNPEDLLCYAYAMFHSPTYRDRFAEFLKSDFPRLPLTSDANLFFELADLGEELVRIHLMRSSKLNEFITGFPHSGSNTVEKLQYQDKKVWFNADQCFSNVPEEDWHFHIGGYQVLDKWLKDRKGRTLTFDDIEHYQKIVVAIHETRRLMAEIDATIPAWPME